jgi:hypothetical protein
MAGRKETGARAGSRRHAQGKGDQPLTPSGITLPFFQAFKRVS